MYVQILLHVHYTKEEKFSLSVVALHGKNVKQKAWPMGNLGKYKKVYNFLASL